MSCACDVKVKIYVDGGGLYKITPTQKTNCHAIDECLFCISMEEVFDDPSQHVFGVYKGICHSAINGPDYFGEYDGEGYVYNVKKLYFQSLLWRISIAIENFFYHGKEKSHD